MKQLFTLLFLISLSGWGYSQSEGMYIGSEDIYVREILCISGSIEDQSNGRMDVQGELCFMNSEEVEIRLSPETDYLNTKFTYKGTDIATIFSNGAIINSLEINSPGGDVKLGDVLVVDDQISLFNGRVIATEDHYLQLRNSSESALLFNNSVGNSAYVIGGLRRYMLPGNMYFFPVGDVNGFHPILLSGINQEGMLKVTYDEQVDENWLSQHPGSELNFSSGGGWIVDTENTTTFEACLSLLGPEGTPLANKYAVFHSTDYPFYHEKPIIDREASPCENFYLKGLQAYSDGVLAVVESNLGYLAKNKELELVNTIVIGSSSHYITRFIVPGMSDFQNIKLKVYNSLGGLIFSSNNYTNELDFRKYRDGTYYYYLNAKLKDGSVINKSDMIEIVRSNE